MMELNLAQPGKKAGAGTVSVSEETFGKEFNEALVTVFSTPLSIHNMTVSKHSQV